MITEDITMQQAGKIVDLIRWELEAHMRHCTLCVPGKWECPDANALSASSVYWQKRQSLIEHALEP